MTNDQHTHAELREWLSEQALGILDGRARAELLAHIEACPSCAEELERLTEAADQLAHLAPGREPPTGFESRTMERIRSSSAPRRVARRGRVLTAVAASLAVAFALGWVVHNVSAPTSPRVATGRFVARDLSAGNQVVGEAYAYTGAPSWMFVTVSAPGDPRFVRCTVIAAGGRHQVVGTFALTDGKGSWGTSLPISYRELRGVVLTAPSGAVIATLGGGAWTDSSPQWTDTGTIPRIV